MGCLLCVNNVPQEDKHNTQVNASRAFFIMVLAKLLPLDGSVRLRRKVVADAVYSRNLGKDSVGDLLKDRPLDLLD